MFDHELEYMFELGRWMGHGERYLIWYEGELAITNRCGLAHWPRGRRQIVAILGVGDCVHGLTLRQRSQISGRLRSLGNSTDSARAG